MKNILVIGGTGFIGSHLVERLIRDAYKVTTLVRRNSDTRFISVLGNVELRIGDLLEPESMNKALLGIDTVFCLVNTKPFGKSQEEYRKELHLLHADGVRNLINACKINKVKRLIYLSSVATIGYKSGIAVYNETSETIPIDDYGKAKLQAEDILIRSAKNNELDITILRPPGVFGERGLGPLGKIIFFTKRGIVPVIGSGKNRQSITYVGNIVNAAICAAKNSDSIGQIYIVSDERPYSVNELVGAVVQAINAHPLVVHIPVWFISCSIWIINFLTELFLKKELINREGIVAISTERIFDGSKIFKEIGYKQEYDLVAGVRRTVDWLGKKNARCIVNSSLRE